MISGPLRWMKCTRLSAATARASNVFPVPGGPYSRTPLGARIPNCSKIRECFRGNSMISRTRATSRSRPPISSYDTAGARAIVWSPSTIRMSVRLPMTTGPEGIVRMTWKFTALANVGTRTTQPAITGTSTRSSSIRSGAMVAGAAPIHNGDSRTATAWAGSTGGAVVNGRDRALLLQSRAAIAATGAVNLDHAFVAVAGNFGARDSNRAAADLENVTRFRFHPRKIGWRQAGEGVADILDARFRYAEFQAGRWRRWKRIGD